MHYAPNSAKEAITFIFIAMASKNSIFTIINTSHYQQNVTTIVKGLSNLKPFRIKIILKIILLKDETKNI